MGNIVAKVVIISVTKCGNGYKITHFGTPLSYTKRVVDFDSGDCV